MTPSTFNLDAALANLNELPPGKRHRPIVDLEKITTAARVARERGVTWAAIVAGLKAAGLPISVARIKELVDGKKTKEKVSPHPGASA